MSLGLFVGWLFLSGLVGPWARAGGPVLFGIVILVAFTDFWWFSMRFLLAGRILRRRLFPSAVAMLPGNCGGRGDRRRQAEG